MVRQLAPQQRKRRVPIFKSREEEAAFWDTHDVADYWDDLKPVRVRFAKNLSQGITIRLDPETLAVLRSRAHEQGLGPTTLARMWILERLRSGAARGALRGPPERREGGRKAKASAR
jgi:predicted DNA binding CopG/RHH family protein